MSKNWSDRESFDAVCRRASGRRHYNAMRKFQATYRRIQVTNLLSKWGFEYGVQARIAQELNVSEATISRDIAAMLKANSSLCPCCRK